MMTIAMPTQRSGFGFDLKLKVETIAVIETAPPKTIGMTSIAFPLLAIMAVVRQSAPRAPSDPAMKPHFAPAICSPKKLKLSPLMLIPMSPPMMAMTR